MSKSSPVIPTKVIPPESEAHFQGVVIDLARMLGWMVFHPWTSIHSESGWPDLFMVRGDRALAAELKTEKGLLTPAQRTWLRKLGESGIDTYVWRPAQKQEIAEILR